jgi:hypothetical protein
MMIWQFTEIDFNSINALRTIIIGVILAMFRQWCHVADILIFGAVHTHFTFHNITPDFMQKK